MTQWKEKTAGEREGSQRLKLGLFSYPVLQAADVLVHATTHVPVGHDQAQHLEFAREVAIGFNHVSGEGVLVPPETIISPAKRIMSLTDSTMKMSKSHSNPKSRILLTDSEEVIRSKVKAAVTDSEGDTTYDVEKRPGVSNLVDILYHCSSDENRSSMSENDFAKDLEGLSMRALKERVSDGIERLVKPIRENYQSLIDNESALEEVAATGAERARLSAAPTLLNVRRAIGLT